MTPSRPRQDRPQGRGLAPWLALAACLVLAAGLTVWGLSVRDQGGTAEAATISSAPSSTSPSPAPAAKTSAAKTPAATIPAADVSAAGGASAPAALMTSADIAATGLTVEQPVAIDAPTFPVLCARPDWGTQWSAPARGVGQRYPATGAAVTEYATGYADGKAASAALARLVHDAVSCPDVSTGGSVQSAGPSTAGGDESAVFLVAGGGRDGVVAMTWSVVVRSGDTLLLVTYTTQQQIGTGSGPGDGGDDSGGDSAGARTTAEALASAAVDRFTAPA